MSHHESSSVGPITDAALEQARPEAGQSKIEEEWMRSLKNDGDFLLLWGGAFKTQWQSREQSEPVGVTWHALMFSDSGLSEQVLKTPAANIELLLSSLAHEARVRLLQALYTGPKSSSELTESTGLRGGHLYYHLKELIYAHYVEQSEGRYRLTERGVQMLITVACLARLAVQDEGERGLVVSEWRDE